MALSVVLIAALATVAAEPIVSPLSGDAQPLSAADIGLHPLGNETYAESWGLICPLDDGGVLLCNLMLSNVGLGDRNPSLGLTYISPQGTITEISRFDLDYIEAAQNRLLVRFQDVSLRGEHPHYTLQVDDDELRLRAQIDALAQPLKVGNGTIGLSKGRFWKWNVFVPRGRIAGTIEISGKSHPINGWVYADHTWSDIPLFSFSRNWLSARIHTDEISVDLFRFLPADGGKHQGAMIVCGREFSGADAAVSWNDAQFASDPTYGFSLPMRTVAEATIEGRRVRVELELGQRLQSFDGLDQLPRVQGILASAVVDHLATYRFGARYTINIEQSGGTPQTLRGECLVEMLYFAQ
ncbi:MAG: hypothetical protein P9M14_14515 [Candidatus Alcyoniella australis]|nr:hypothetical protein [Candidatus Alcyoniella australis]